MDFIPDYTQIEAVLHNRRPGRLPLYEHHIDIPFIEKVRGKTITIEGSQSADFENYYRQVTSFWKEMTYDAFDYEAAVCDLYPGHGAITGGMLGPIQTRDDFNKYPFDEIPGVFWETYTPHLVGYESRATLQYTDPDLFADLFGRIGDLYMELWTEMCSRYGDIFVFFRMGDDLGFKTSTLLEPDTIRRHILPQYKRVIDIVHRSGKKFLLHSCGNIFEVMEDIISVGIDAKHSNEDEIAPFEDWIKRYNDRIGLFGGIDVNTLCLNSYDEVKREIIEKGTRFRKLSRGYGLGSGNSIAEYVPVEGFMAMVDAVKEIRKSPEIITA